MFRHILVHDWETSGFAHETRFDAGGQGLQYGGYAVRASDLAIVDSFCINIRYEGAVGGTGLFPHLSWSREAEAVHGLTREYLASTGVSVAEAARQFEDFVRRFWFPDEKILSAGHNPSFDRRFTDQLLFLGGKKGTIRFHHRMIDTFSLGFSLFGTEDSNELFEMIGVTRSAHDAQEDAMACLSVLRSVRKFKSDADERTRILSGVGAEMYRKASGL